MAEYNFFNARNDSELVTGTESNDSIEVYGNHSTVQALGGDDIISVNGGRHDSGIWIGDEDNLIFAGAGNDSIAVHSRGASVYGEGGNDTINVRRSYAFADGGDGNDVLYLRDRNYNSYVGNVTLTGGNGADTFEIVPYDIGVTLNAAITDFSNEDSFRVDDDENRAYSYSIQNGNVVITDDKIKRAHWGDTLTENVEPQFSVTLQGVGSINEIADAKFYHYDSAGNVPKEYKTFGEMFGVTQIDTQPAATEPVTVPAAVTETIPAVTETIPAATVDATQNVTNINNNINVNVNVIGLNVYQNLLTMTNQFMENLWLGGFNFLTNQFMSYGNQYSQIVSLDASQTYGQKILAGNSQNNIITAGNGGSSIWGGGSGTQNTLTGGAGRDMFFFLNEFDFVKQFTTGRAGDVLNLSGVNLTSYYRESSYMSFSAADGSGIQIQDSSSVDTVIQYTTDGVNTSFAKIGMSSQANRLTYEDGVNFYSGGSQIDVLNVATYESRNIWLDGSQGVTYKDINNIDATNSRGNNQLAGNSNSNEIKAGAGNDSLWGGAGNEADDSLIGGTGENTFFYGVNNGNDVIINSAATDTVNLFNVSLSDIVSAGERGTDFVVNMAGGQSLVIQGQNGASNFTLSDGSAYNYSRENHSFTRTR